MNSKEHYELFRYLMEQLCLLPEDLIFVEDISDWCRENGIPETDAERPFRLIAKKNSGCRMLVKEYISDEAIHQRINGLSVRGQLKNVAFDRADTVDSDRKRLAYLFLSEYAISLPGIEDEFLADNWAFDEMTRLGFFKQ
jgi:hypothetical protein